jgi:hypothetical protein
MKRLGDEDGKLNARRANPINDSITFRRNRF